jgi:L-serine dehydratase
MKEYGIFDILGPIMIGPSSSHTAGAAKLGKTSEEIYGDDFDKVDFYLHGSFAKTYKGHGTDKARVAGILGMEPSSEKLKDSFIIAKEKGIEFNFYETDLGYEHPNTVKIVFHKDNKRDFYIIGSSIGGGSILITDINGNKVELTGESPTLILEYPDKKGVISKVGTILAYNNINIANMKVSRFDKNATMIVETDNFMDKKILDEISAGEEIIYGNIINPVRR